MMNDEEFSNSCEGLYPPGTAEIPGPETLQRMRDSESVKHGIKQYDLVTYHTAGVYLPEAFYTVTELNEFIATIEQRNTVANLALARSMEPV